MKRTGTILQAVLSMTLLGVVFSPIFARAQDPNQYPDQGQDQNQGDPPGRAARLTYEQGAVSLQQAGSDQWSDAGRNYPLTSGDRLYVDNGGRAEIQAGQTAARMGPGSDLTITNLTDQLTQFGLAQGTVRLRTYGLDPNSSVELDTPNGAITVVRPGDVRVESNENGTQVTVNTGSVQVSGPSLSQEIAPGQAVLLTGTDPVQISNINMPGYDDFDRFSIDRDKRILNSQSARYVSRDMTGYDDLDDNGTWDNTSEAGPVWYPRNVSADWQPYRDGHWAYVQPWGWTWVDNASWGFAPFHYGRWSYYGNRWGWVPGPVAVAPVYSPALVAFVGGSGFSIGIGLGGGGGVSAWFPLGVGEPYVPWYRCSPRYVQQVNVTNVNITNIHNTTIVNNYNTFITNTRNVTNVNNINTTNINYAHKTNGVTAVPAAAFASGRPVAQAAVKVNPAQLQRATVVRQGPVAVKPVQAALIRPVTHAAPPIPQARPVVLTKKGPAITVPNARPLAAMPAKLGEAKPGTPAAAASEAARTGKPLPPSAIARPAQPAATTPGARPGQPPTNQPNRPGQPPTAQPNRPGQPATANQPNRPAAQPAPTPARPVTPAPGNNNAPRPLITKNPPPTSAPAANNNRLPPPTNQARPATPAPQARPAPEQPQRPAPAPEAQRPAPTPQVQRPAPAEQRPAPTPQVQRPAPEQQRPAPTPQVQRAAPEQQRPAPTPQAERPAPVQRPAPTPQAERPVQQRPAPAPQAERPAPAPRPAPEARPAPAQRPAPEARPAPPPSKQAPPPKDQKERPKEPPPQR